MANAPIPARFRRFVALGDSTTEGVGDAPHPDGTPRGWADRFAAELARHSPDLLYANLAVRGRRISELREDQLPVALTLAPDLVSMIIGINDLIRPRFDLRRALHDLGQTHTALRRSEATVITATFPNISSFSPATRLVSGRLARYNEGLRAIAEEHGALLLDLARWPAAADPRLWSEDRLHLSPFGHALLARAMFASLVRSEGADSVRLDGRPALVSRSRLAREAHWAYRYFLPWIGRRVMGRSSGDGRVAKRPKLTPMPQRLTP